MTYTYLQLYFNTKKPPTHVLRNWRFLREQYNSALATRQLRKAYELWATVRRPRKTVLRNPQILQDNPIF